MEQPTMNRIASVRRIEVRLTIRLDLIGAGAAQEDGYERSIENAPKPLRADAASLLEIDAASRVREKARHRDCRGLDAKRKAREVLHVLVAVELGNNEPQRRAVVQWQRFALESIGEKRISRECFLEWDRCLVARFTGRQSGFVATVWARLNPAAKPL